MNVSSDSAKGNAFDTISWLILLTYILVFGYFVNLTTIFGLLSWISILVTHIYFVKARKAQGILDKSMHYKAPLGIWGSYIALTFCVIIAITKNFASFLLKKPDGSFDREKFVEDFITG